MREFNLVDEKWIPCLMQKGPPQEMGLKEVLARAHEIREVFDPSPLVTVSLHRLMLAILHRNFGPANLAEWKALWNHGCWKAEALANYFSRWFGRFNLFDPSAPFYQQAGFAARKETPVKRLAFEFAAQNNATLFDHSTDDDRPEIAPAVAARWTVVCHTFAPSAGKSETLHTKDSPWTRGAVIVFQGDNLFQTLALNLLNGLRDDFPTVGDDLPAWERDGNGEPEHGLTPSGLLEYLTWQSRWLRLLPEPSGFVRNCYLAQGRAVKEDFRSDPMLAYRRDEEAGLLVWMLNQDRALWRDSHSLLNFAADSPFMLPRAFNRISMLVRQGTLDRRRRFQLCVLGQRLESGQPTIHFWRHERLPLPLEYLDDPGLVGKLHDALTLAENVGDTLSSSGWKLARLTLLPDESKQLNKQQKLEVKNLWKHLAATRIYWSRLETAFKEFIVELPHGDAPSLTARWAVQLRNAALDAFADVVHGLERSPRSLKAIAKTEIAFRHDINTVLQP